MQRVLVIGCSGAGKSVFARKLGEATGLPVVHLDQIYWRAGWNEPDSSEWRQAAIKLVREPRWIQDGNYGSTLDMRLSYADTVFFFDTPRWTNLTGVLRRIWQHYGQTRPDLADGCPERIDWSFLKYVWTFNHKQRPRTVASLRAFNGTLVTFRSRVEADTYLRALSTTSNAA
jgi:adenylate kinase family enzyme